MKRFETKQIAEAVAFAAAGGQALHVCRASQFVGPMAPACFQRSALFAHLIDHDRERLERTARQLGVWRVKVERVNDPMQHVDLCGQPLERALEQCDEETAAARQWELAL